MPQALAPKNGRLKTLRGVTSRLPKHLLTNNDMEHVVLYNAETTQFQQYLASPLDSDCGSYVTHMLHVIRWFEGAWTGSA